MPMTDALTYFFNDKDVGTSATVTSDVIDFGTDDGPGETDQMRFHFYVTSAYSSSQSATVKLEHSTDNSNWSELLSFEADLHGPDEVFNSGLPYGAARYLRVKVEHDNAPGDGGTISAFIAM